MKTVKVASRYACGCQVRQVENSESPFLDSYLIEYCPKHEAAPDMYEALKSLAKMREMLKLHKGDYEKLAEVIGVKSVEELIDLTISEAIAKAEGKEVEV